MSKGLKQLEKLRGLLEQAAKLQARIDQAVDAALRDLTRKTAD